MSEPTQGGGSRRGALMVILSMLLGGGAVAVILLLAKSGSTTARTTVKTTDQTPYTAKELKPEDVGNPTMAQNLESKTTFERERVFQYGSWNAPTAALGETAVRYLRKGLADAEPSVRMAAAERAAQITKGPDAKNLTGFSADEVKPVCEALLTDPQFRLRAATLLWQRFEARSGGQGLADIVSDRKWSAWDRVAAIRLHGPGDPPSRAKEVHAALQAVFIDRADDAVVRAAAGRELNDGLIGEPWPEPFRTSVQAILNDPKEPSTVRAEALDLLTTTTTQGPTDDASRTRSADLARAPDTPGPLRVRAFALLAPRSARFAKDHPDLAKLLQEAVTDPKQDPGFRQFAFHFYPPDTPERFAAAVEALAGRDPATLNLRWSVAKLLHEKVKAEKGLPPEWLTPRVLRGLAASDVEHLRYAQPAPYSEAGKAYSPPRPANWAWDLEHTVVKALRPHWGDVLPELCLQMDQTYTKWQSHEYNYGRGWDIFNDAGTTFPRLTALQTLAGGSPAVYSPTLPNANVAVESELIRLITDAEQPERVRLAAMRVLTWITLPVAARNEHTYDPAQTPERPAQLELVKRYRYPETLPRPSAVDCCPILLKKFPDNSALLTAVAAAVGKMGPEGKAAIPDLLAACKRHPTAVMHCTSALAAIGPDSVPALGELMKEKEPKLRIAAADALGLIGPEGRSKATPILRSAVEQEKDEAVKKAALDALGQVNPAEAKKLGWTAK